MTIFLYGPDSYRKQEKLQELLASYKEKYSQTDIMHFDLGGKTDSWEDVKDFITQPSMFVSSKIAVVKDGVGVDNKKWIKLVKDELEAKGTTIIFLEEKKPLKRFEFLLKKPSRFQKFDELTGRALEEFLKKQAEKEEVVFDVDAWKLFVSAVKTHEVDRSWVAVQAIRKLSLAVGKKKVATKDIEDQMNFSRKEKVFSLAGSILRSRSIGEKLTAIEQLFIQRESPSYIFNSLAYQVRGKAAVQFADYDVLVKSGKLEYEEVFLDYIFGGDK